MNVCHCCLKLSSGLPPNSEEIPPLTSTQKRGFHHLHVISSAPVGPATRHVPGPWSIHCFSLPERSTCFPPLEGSFSSFCSSLGSELTCCNDVICLSVYLGFIWAPPLGQGRLVFPSRPRSRAWLWHSALCTGYPRGRKVKLWHPLMEAGSGDWGHPQTGRGSEKSHRRAQGTPHSGSRPEQKSVSS